MESQIPAVTIFCIFFEDFSGSICAYIVISFKSIHKGDYTLNTILHLSVFASFTLDFLPNPDLNSSSFILIAM